MSTKSTKSTSSNTLADDLEQKEEQANQADIQALYDELALEQAAQLSINKHEQPSVELDQSILAAAHKAVSQKPRLVIKKYYWYLPLASAASAVLVFSLFFNQLEQVPLQPMTQPQVPLQQAALQQEVDLSSTLVQMSVEPAVSENRQQLLKIKEQRVKSEKKVAKSMSRMRTVATAEENEFMAGQVSDDKQIVELEVNILSIVQYEEFKQANYLWTYVDENSQDYQIKIYTDSQGKKVFQLAKKSYFINKKFKSNKDYELNKIKQLEE